MIEARTPEKIHHEIADKLARGVSYIDALVDYANKHNLEIETVAEIVKRSQIMKEKIKSEALKMRLVKPDDNAPRQLCD
jgi:IMP cyclohydrolase